MNTIINNITSFISNISSDKINGLINNKITYSVIIAVIAVVIGIAIFKRLLNLSVRVLMGVLLIAFVLFVGPRINVFILNKLEAYGFHGIIETKLSEIIDGDIEAKVIRDYKMETGQDIDINNRALIEELKAEAFKVNPEMNDELNLIANAGFPKIVTKTILLNIKDPGSPTIVATSFPEYTAKFLILRMVTLLSYLIAFLVAYELFREPGSKYGKHYLT